MAQDKNVILDTSRQFTLKGTLLWPALFTPKQFPPQNGQEQLPKYQATILFDANDEFTSYKRAKADLANDPRIAKFGDEWFQTLKSAIRKELDPEVIEKYPFLKDRHKATASSMYAPTVMKRDGKTKYSADDKEEIYSGCYGQAVVSLGIHNKDKFFLRLLGFQKIRDGEPLGFTGAKSDLFESFTDSLAENDDI